MLDIKHCGGIHEFRKIATVVESEDTVSRFHTNQWVIYGYVCCIQVLSLETVYALVLYNVKKSISIAQKSVKLDKYQRILRLMCNWNKLIKSGVIKWVN